MFVVAGALFEELPNMPVDPLLVVGGLFVCSPNIPPPWFGAEDAVPNMPPLSAGLGVVEEAKGLEFGFAPKSNPLDCGGWDILLLELLRTAQNYQYHY